MPQAIAMPNGQRTVGIEIEGIIPARINGTPGRHALAAALTAAGIPARALPYSESKLPHDDWVITSDGSISPDGSDQIDAEVVSPPLAGAAFIDQIQKVCAILRQAGFKTNDRCGLHVHHATDGMDLRNMKVLACKYLNHEGFMDLLMEPTRRGTGTTHVQSNRSFFRSLPVAARYKQINSARSRTELFTMFQGRSRYYKVNFEPITKTSDTIEFRHHHSTIDAAAIIAWAILTQSMIEDAIAFQTVVTNVRKQDDAGSFFRVVPESMREPIRQYYEKRMEAFDATESSSGLR